MLFNIKDLILGLKNKSDDIKLKTAINFKSFVVNDLKDKIHDEIVSFIDGMFIEFLNLMDSNDASDKKAVLIAICSIADIDLVFSHNRFSDLSKQINDLPLSNDIQINALKSRFLAQLNLIFTTADKVESQIKESCMAVVDDSKLDAHKIYAAITLRDYALYASTIFFQHATRVISSLLIGIRDKQANVREACALAMTAAFSVTASREGIMSGNRGHKGSGVNTTAATTTTSSSYVNENKLMTSISIMRGQITNQLQQQLVNYNRPSIDESNKFGASLSTTSSTSTIINSSSNLDNNTTSGSNMISVGEWNENLYVECIKNILRNPDENFQLTNRKLPLDAWNHGTLLLVNELLKLSNSDLEMTLLNLEERMDMPMEQLCTTSASNQIMSSIIAVRNACQMNWPLSNTEEHIFNHRARTFHSNWCEEIIQKNMDKIWPLILHNYDTSNKLPFYILQLLLITIPRLIGQNSTNDKSLHTTKKTLEFIQKLIKKDRDLKPLIFITLGLVIGVAPNDFQKSGQLELTMDMIHQYMPNKDLAPKKRQPILEMTVYMLIGLIALGCRNNVYRYIKDMIQPMVDAGLSLPLIYSLKMVSCSIKELINDIHTTLLKCLRQTLMNGKTANLDSIGPATTPTLASTSDIFNQPFTITLSPPVFQSQLPPDQLEARNKILALKTFMHFEFDKHNLSIFVRFISQRLFSFVLCPYRELRIEAVRTCAQLLRSLLGNEDVLDSSNRNTLNAVAEVLEKLLIVSSSDPDFQVRLCVFQSMDDRFDSYLAQQCHLGALFMSLNDEKFEIRRIVIRLLGRLSAINPSCLKPGLRKILLQLLHELEFSGSSVAREQATKLLAELIDTAPGFIQPHAEQLLMLLLPRIGSIVEAANKHGIVAAIITNNNNNSIPNNIQNHIYPSVRHQIECSPTSTCLIKSYPKSETNTVVQLAILEAIKNLAVVAGTKLRRYLDELIPALILLMQDGAALQKRQASVATLSRLLTHTGYVVLPYRRYPRLLPLLFNMLRTEEVGSIRREIIKLFGTIGALDPFKLRSLDNGDGMNGDDCSLVLLSRGYDTTTNAGQVGDTGLVVSMHEVVEKKEVDMSQAELLVNVMWGSIDEFYTACSLQALIQLIRDPAYRPYFDKICYAIMVIFKSLGSKSVQYLRQILPEYFRCIVDAPDNRQQEILLGQLCLITDVVKLHLKQFMPQLITILVQLWNKVPSLTNMCIKVLQNLNKALGTDMKLFLTPLIPLFQQTLASEAEQSIIKILDLFPEFGYSIEESIYTLLPSIMKIISREDGEIRLEIKKHALECLTRICEQLDLSDVAGRIVHPVCRMLAGGLGSISSSPTSSVSLISSTSNVTSTITTSSSTVGQFNTTNSSSIQQLTSDQLSFLVPPSFDLLTTLLVKMNRRFLILSPIVLRTVELIKPLFKENSVPAISILRYNNTFNKVLKVYFVNYPDDDMLKYESVATRKHNQRSKCYEEGTNEVNVQKQQSQQNTEVDLDKENTTAIEGTPGVQSISNNKEEQMNIFTPPKTNATEDWLIWLRRMSLSLLNQSPSASLRACARLDGCTIVLGRALFNAAFASCWPELPDTIQDFIVTGLEFVLKECPSTEVSQAVLNLEEFMSRCDRMKLPIPTAVLASRALKNRVYAKALYYKEQEFLEETAKRGVAPQPLLFELLSINHKLQLEEAAIGVVKYATEKYKDKLLNEELWHERLQDWTKALNLYERKLEELDSRSRYGSSISTASLSGSISGVIGALGGSGSNTPSSDLVLGRMRCLHALGDWSTLRSIGIERFHSSNSSEEDKVRLTPMIVSSAWALGDFKTMANYVDFIPMTGGSSGTRGGFEGCFMRAVVCVQQERFLEAEMLIQQARDELDSCLTAMAGESYIRAYADLVEAQKLAEIEEVIQYKLVREGRETIRNAWAERLNGCQESLEDWRQLLQIRGLVLHPLDDLGRGWVRFAGLARRQGRMELCRAVLDGLESAANLNQNVEASLRLIEHRVRVTFARAKYLWASGFNKQAMETVESLLKARREELIQRQATQMTADGTSGFLMEYFEEKDAKELRNFYAKCNMRLGQWISESSSPGTSTPSNTVHHDRIIRVYRAATEESPWLPRAWQAWAMSNYALMCQLKSKIVEINKEMNNIALRWYSLRHTQNDIESGDKPTFNPNTIPTSAQSPNTQNSATSTIPNSQLPHEILRMSQPQLRYTLLQQHCQKRGMSNGLVTFPSPAPQPGDSITTFGQAAAVMRGDLVGQSAQSIPSNSLSASSSSASFLLRHSNLDTLAQNYQNLELEKRRLFVEQDNLAPAAVRGLVNAVALAPAHQLPQEGAGVRLVILLFRSGRLPKVRETVREGLTRVRLEAWLPLLHQLLARLDTAAARDEPTAAIVTGLLSSIGEKHPQAVLGPLTLAFKSGGSDRRRHHANKVLHSLETHSARLVSEAFLLNEELIRLAISWLEMWTEALEDASRLYYEDKNVVAMFKNLHPLHLLMDSRVETAQEEAFYNEYAHDLTAAKNLCVRYESSNYKTDLTQAWEIYSNLYRKWCKQISNLSMIELSVASPRLYEYKDWQLAIPGSYNPRRAANNDPGGVIKIASIKNCLTMMTSKQHPRKLTLIGSDGHNYVFLLKGHEDIRQDERAMQFFGLINTLLADDPNTVRRNLTIQRMSVIPLSTNTGLIGWVPNSDTLNALIREYREKTGVLLNREHKEMLKIAPDYDKLNVIQKTEVFESAMHDSDGRDLAHILWQKSHNSEAWFEKRTNFIRSLAVMSMVGYILGLGDRHPSNIMLCRQSGKVIHIDFGDCFEVATMREKYPEKVPFRLTRMLIGAMEVTGLSGVFRLTCVELIKLMRRHADSLLAVLEAFIHDPLLQWVLNAANNTVPTNTAGVAVGGSTNMVPGAGDTFGPGMMTHSGATNQYHLQGPDAQQMIAIQTMRKYLQLPLIATGLGNMSNLIHQTSSHHINLDQTNLINNNNVGISNSNSSGSVGLLNMRIFTDPNYPDSRSLRNPYSINQWRHHLCNGPWLGKYETACKMRKRAPDESIIVERNGLEGLIFSAKPTNYTETGNVGGMTANLDDSMNEEEWAGANLRAMEIMSHIQNKLDGREQGGDANTTASSMFTPGLHSNPTTTSMATVPLTADQHVDVLINQATSNYNLCQMYFGWCAFW